MYLVRLGWIFFIGAHMVLCSGFVIKTVSITHQYFSYCWTVLAQQQDLLCFPLYFPTPCQASRLKGRQKIVRSHWQDSWPKLTKGILLHKTPSLAKNSGGHIFQSNCCLETGWASHFLWNMASYCLCVTWYPHTYTPSFTFKLSSSWPKSFSCICSSDSLPHLAGFTWATSWLLIANQD